MTDAIAELLAVHTPDVLGAPFGVRLIGSVRRDVNDGITIPDLPGLVACLTMARLQRDERLSGADLRFVRKSAGVTRTRLEDSFGGGDGDVEAYEKGPRPMTIGLEKYIRLHLFDAARRVGGPRVTEMMEYMDWIFESWKPTFGDTSRPLTIRMRHMQEGWLELKD